MMLSVYGGEDFVPINHLFVNARKVLVSVKLSEFLCQQAIESGTVRINQLEQSYAKESSERQVLREQIDPRIKFLMRELTFAKEKLDSLDTKMKLYEAECILKKDALDNASNLLAQNENDYILKKRFDEAKKASKVSEARFTIAQHVYQDEKSSYDIKERELNDSLQPLKMQCLDLEKVDAEKKIEIHSAVKTITDSIAHATSTLEPVQKAYTLIQEHMMAWAEAVFTSSYVMGKEIEVFQTMLECIKGLARDCIPDNFVQGIARDDDMNIYVDDAVEMKTVLRQVTTTCPRCKLPMIGEYNESDDASSRCVFCVQDIPAEETPTEKIPTDETPTEEIPAEVIVTESNAVKEETNLEVLPVTDDAAETTMESTIERDESIAMDPEIMARLTKEAGNRILNGWVLKDDLICKKCENQMMSNRIGKTSICILCDVILRENLNGI